MTILKIRKMIKEATIHCPETTLKYVRGNVLNMKKELLFQNQPRMLNRLHLFLNIEKSSDKHVSVKKLNCSSLRDF